MVMYIVFDANLSIHCHFKAYKFSIEFIEFEFAIINVEKSVSLWRAQYDLMYEL